MLTLAQLRRLLRRPWRARRAAAPPSWHGEGGILWRVLSREELAERPARPEPPRARWLDHR
jgi:hypothetical protein